MDAVTREVLQGKLVRHRPAWWWRLLGVSRCRACGLRWRPCPAYKDADRALRTIR